MFFEPEASPFSTGVAGSDFFADEQSAFGVTSVPGVCATTGTIAKARARPSAIIPLGLSGAGLNAITIT